LNDKSFEDQQNANDDLSPKVYSTPKPGYADNELKENGALEYQQEPTTGLLLTNVVVPTDSAQKTTFSF
jgi:hypothetical protein